MSAAAERVWERRGLYRFADGAEWTRPVTGEGEPASENWMAFAYGRRSDGQNFSVSIEVTPEGRADEAHMAALLRERFDLLDTFLDPRCECEGRKLCAWHRTFVPHPPDAK